jgi:hypothetical protein
MSPITGFRSWQGATRGRERLYDGFKGVDIFTSEKATIFSGIFVDFQGVGRYVSEIKGTVSMRDTINGGHFRLRLPFPEVTLTTFRSKTTPSFQESDISAPESRFNAIWKPGNSNI